MTSAHLRLHQNTQTRVKASVNWDSMNGLDVCYCTTLNYNPGHVTGSGGVCQILSVVYFSGGYSYTFGMTMDVGLYFRSDPTRT